MKDYSNLLNYKYGFGDGQLNCIDLCREFYKLQGWKETFTDDKPLPTSLEEFNKSHKLHMMKYLIRNFDVTKDISLCEYGDIVVFNILGDLHTGVVVDNNEILAMQVPCLEGIAKPMVYKYKYWSQAFLYCFKRRKGLKYG